MTESQRKNAESQRKTPDREKVIRGLECIAQQLQNGTCGGCAYFRPFTDDPDCGWCDSVAIKNDALALLREQEAAKVTTRRITANGGSIVWTCGKCGADLAPNNAKAKYCSACGRAVKWDA